MAIWQFDFYFIARGALAPDLSAEAWDAPPLPLAVVHSLQSDLAHYFGLPWLMLPDWIVFGPERGNRVDVLFETETDASIFVRCDVRDEAPQFIVLICNLARSLGCQFFSPKSGEVFEPNLEVLGKVIGLSRART